jgi:hypothetical protein
MTAGQRGARTPHPSTSPRPAEVCDPRAAPPVTATHCARCTSNAAPPHKAGRTQLADSRYGARLAPPLLGSTTSIRPSLFLFRLPDPLCHCGHTRRSPPRAAKRPPSRLPHRDRRRAVEGPGAADGGAGLPPRSPSTRRRTNAAARVECQCESFAPAARDRPKYSNGIARDGFEAIARGLWRTPRA